MVKSYWMPKTFVIVGNFGAKRLWCEVLELRTDTLNYP